VFEHNIERVKNERLARAIQRHLETLREATGLSESTAATLVEALKPFVDGAGRSGDIVHAGDDAALRFIAGALDAYEISDCTIWSVGTDTANARGDGRIRAVSLDELDEVTRVAVVSTGQHGDEAALREALGTRIAPDAVFV
jgi:hypothetical protein